MRLLSSTLQFVAFFVFAVPSQAGLVVSEVMSNEPSGSTSLEWIELYNDSSVTAYLVLYDVRVNGVSVQFDQPPAPIEPYEYFVICRKLFSDSISPGFEGVWGDSSGTWDQGEPSEDYRQPAEAAFPILTNSGGTVAVYSASQVLISSLSWLSAGSDGISWERVTPAGTEIEQSIDEIGATPGTVNSVTPLPNDLALRGVHLSSREGTTYLEFLISNCGTQLSSEGELIVYYDDDSVPLDGMVITRLDYGALTAGDSMTVIGEIVIDGMYTGLSAQLEPDDRERNNRLTFIAPGIEFPPLILSEFLARSGGVGTEWVEIYNISGSPVDLNGWQLGDSLGLHSVTDAAILIDADDYAVAADDTIQFHGYYTLFDGSLLEPSTWPPLNDNGDAVRLVDSFGIEADRFDYTRTFDGDHTWGRTEPVSALARWGRSVDGGGTPGDSNAVLLVSEAGSIGVDIEPKVFSPDGIGGDELCIITVEAPEADSYTLKIYDRQGRVVRTLVDEEQFLMLEYEWDGYSDDGDHLPIGIYIVYFEASGVESVKETVVIAR